ncbi:MULTISPECIES: helix-turn-helix transcriptional regulator [unclassified Pseudomonas]|uniref:helix-turn-helix domain-containing protein n=1 Tax=unclassified Pseudomonas TaxID=196821 RepID=UPI0009E062A0
MARNVHTQAIGTALAAYFLGQGMTQAQVAARYGISQSWVGRIYNGEFSARATTVSKMCESAGVPFLQADMENQRDVATRYRLLRLLDSVWEGTEEDANHLTVALLAIKKLRAPLERARK